MKTSKKKKNITSAFIKIAPVKRFQKGRGLSENIDLPHVRKLPLRRISFGFTSPNILIIINKAVCFTKNRIMKEIIGG